MYIARQCLLAISVATLVIVLGLPRLAIAQAEISRDHPIVPKNVVCLPGQISIHDGYLFVSCYDNDSAIAQIYMSSIKAPETTLYLQAILKAMPSPTATLSGTNIAIIYGLFDYLPNSQLFRTLPAEIHETTAPIYLTIDSSPLSAITCDSAGTKCASIIGISAIY